jgi:hypothetical protein
MTTGQSVSIRNARSPLWPSRKTSVARAGARWRTSGITSHGLANPMIARAGIREP